MFQSLAVVLAKQKWPDLIATEWHKDGGLDAYAAASMAEGKKGKGVAFVAYGDPYQKTGVAKTAKNNYAVSTS